MAKLVVTADGVHTAHRKKSLNTNEQIRKQAHKVDFRLKPKAFHLACPRFCRKAKKVASTDSSRQ